MKSVFMSCPACGDKLEIIPEELFGETNGIVVTICDKCDMWWVTIPGTEIEDLEELMRLMGKVVVDPEDVAKK